MTKQAELIDVAEAILDGAASEYLDDNLATAAAVEAYAENGMGLLLTTAQAQKIKDTCVNWIFGVQFGELDGVEDYYYHVTKPLIETYNWQIRRR